MLAVSIFLRGIKQQFCLGECLGTLLILNCFPRRCLTIETMDMARHARSLSTLIGLVAIVSGKTFIELSVERAIFEFWQE